MGELEDMAVDLGRAEGTLYMCKLLRKFKIGTNSIQREAARMWKETCQRAVGGVDMEKESGKRNVRVVMEKVDTLRREVVISIREGRLRLEEKVKEVFREKGIRLGSRGAKNIKIYLEGERVKAQQEERTKKEIKVAQLRKKYGGMQRVGVGGDDDHETSDYYDCIVDRWPSL